MAPAVVVPHCRGVKDLSGAESGAALHLRPSWPLSTIVLQGAVKGAIVRQGATFAGATAWYGPH